jgi:hypothetical protein
MPILPLLQMMALHQDSPLQSWSTSASLPPPRKERFARKKHARFPGGAIAYCLAEAGLPTVQT